MIELEVQFKIVIISILFGMIFTNLYTLFDIMLRKSKVFRSIIELCFFIIGSSSYYFIIYKINKEDIQYIFQDPYSSLNPYANISYIISEGLKFSNKEEKERFFLKTIFCAFRTYACNIDFCANSGFWY